MLQRLLLLLGATAIAVPGAAQCAPAGPAMASTLDAPASATSQAVPPKNDEKKNEVTLWVLDASGKG